MNKTAIIYSFNTKKTGKVAERIKEAFNDDMLEMVNAEEISEALFMSFDQIIMGVPTWFDGELPNYWDEFVPALEDFGPQWKKSCSLWTGRSEGIPRKLCRWNGPNG